MLRKPAGSLWRRKPSLNSRRILGLLAALVGISGHGCSEPATDEVILQLLAEPAPFHVVTEPMFRELGWDLPDGGRNVQALADEARGSAFDPRELEKLAADELGYRADWHEVRFEFYNIDWDIGALELTPATGGAGLPTLVVINGGAANWYEFFVGPTNKAGLGQYLAQKLRVLLLTIPGNYRHGGWDDPDFGNRIPAYLLDRELSAEEARLRNASYTFRVVTEGVKAAIDAIVDGPAIIVGHSTGGEVQFILRDWLDERNGPGYQSLSLGWGTGGPAGLGAMQTFRGERRIDDYPHVSQLRARTSDQYSGGYLGPLNPYWSDELSRKQVAALWMGAEAVRRPQFKQPLQDLEHSSAINLRDALAAQIRETLAGNALGIDAEAVIDDLFTTMHSPVGGWRRMIWTAAARDTGHWSTDINEARELLIANEFQVANPDAEIRVLLFDLPMTHYGHIEQPRELAGGLLVALRWLLAG